VYPDGRRTDRARRMIPGAASSGSDVILKSGNVRWKPALAIALLVAGASYALWQWRLQVRVGPLEPDWPAVVTVLAGDGVAGMRDGDASRARFSDPFGVAVAADGSIYLADAGDAQRIRRITPDGRVSTLAGGGLGYVDGAGSIARFDTPSALAIDAAGALYVADTGNHVIRRITPDGLVSTIAGDGVAGYRDGPAAEARFNGPVGVAVDGAGRVIVADTYNDRIRSIEADGTVTTVAGSGRRGRADGASAEAEFDTPCAVGLDSGGNVYVADTGNDALRRIDPDGSVSTVDAAGAEALFRPIGLAVTSDGIIYAADEWGRVVEVTPGGRARTIAGSSPGFADGDGAAARFRGPAGVAIVAPGRLVVADSRNAVVRLVAARSQLELRLPASPLIAPAFDADAFDLPPLWWPFDSMTGPFEITGTMGEARGEDGTERFHAGVDVSGDQGMSVFTVRPGVVASPVAATGFGTLSESVRIGPIAYVHLRVGRRAGNEQIDRSRFVPSFDETGALVGMRVRRGARFITGERIGTLNAFNHAHINVGWPGEEVNPLRFRLVQFEDTVPPTIAGVSLFSEQGEPLTRRERRRLVVAGRVQIVVDAWDQVDGNEPRRRLGLYSLGYQVLHPNGSPAPGFDAPRETIVFDRFAGDDGAARVVFAPGSGIPFYGRRRTRFLYTVTNTFRGGIASPGWWDTGSLPPGDYTLRIFAGDIRGNLALANRDVPVIVGAPPHSP